MKRTVFNFALIASLLAFLSPFNAQAQSQKKICDYDASPAFAANDHVQVSRGCSATKNVTIGANISALALTATAVANQVIVYNSAGSARPEDLTDCTLPTGYLNYNATTGHFSCGPAPTVSSAAYSSLLAATGTNSIDNGNYTQSFNWNAFTSGIAQNFSSSTLTSGTLLNVFATTTVGKGLAVTVTGPSNAGYAGYFENTSTISGYAAFFRGNIAVTGTASLGTAQISSTGAAAGITLNAGVSNNVLQINGIAVSSVQGTSSKVQLALGSVTSGHIAIYDGTGNVVDSGTTPGSVVNVTAGTPDIVINPTPGTGTFTVSSSQPLNELGTAATYTILSSDMGKTLTHNKASPVAVTLPQAGTSGFETGKSVTEINIGVGIVTITPNSSTINGQTSLQLPQGASVYLISNGTNWIAFAGAGTAVSVTAGSANIQISPTPGTGQFTVATTNAITALGATATYSVAAGDMGRLITHAKSTTAVEILAAGTVTGFGAGAGYSVFNEGPGALQIITTGGATINGGASVTLTTNQGASLISTTTNWDAAVFGGTTTGSGTPAYLDVAQSWTKAQRSTPITVAISTATFTPDFSLGNEFGLTLVHASCPCTLANPTNLVAGQSGVILVTQSATGSDLISTYGSAWKFPGSTKPTYSMGASKIDLLSYYVIDSSTIAATVYGLDLR